MIARVDGVRKESHHMRTLPALLLLALAPVGVHATTATDLFGLLASDQVHLSPTGTGKHAGESVRVTVRNTSGKSLSASIPPGWVFNSVNEQVQDLIVVREEVFVLAPGASKTITCRAFCTQGKLRGPREGEPYTAGSLGAPRLVELAQAVNGARYDDGLVQSAVWVLSDGYPIAGMGALDSTAADTLRYLVSRLSGQPPPRYRVHFLNDGESVCTGRPEMIERRFSITVGVPSEISAVVLDRQGQVLHVFEDHTLIRPGSHRYQFQLPVADWPSGQYAIHVWTTDRTGVHRLPFRL